MEIKKLPIYGKKLSMQLKHEKNYTAGISWDALGGNTQFNFT